MEHTVRLIILGYRTLPEDADTDEQLERLVAGLNTLRNYDTRAEATLTLKDATMFTYETHEEMTAFLRRYADDYPAITRMYSVGRSVQGREMWVLEISDNPSEHEPGRKNYSFPMNDFI